MPGSSIVSTFTLPPQTVVSTTTLAGQTITTIATAGGKLHTLFSTVQTWNTDIANSGNYHRGPDSAGFNCCRNHEDNRILYDNNDHNSGTISYHHLCYVYTSGHYDDDSIDQRAIDYYQLSGFNTTWCHDHINVHRTGNDYQEGKRVD